MSRRRRKRAEELACLRVMCRSLPQSWSVSQLAAATGLPLVAVRRAQGALLRRRLVRDTGGVRYGTMVVRSVDTTWERAVFRFLTGGGS